jgi:hypothetical protein
MTRESVVLRMCSIEGESSTVEGWRMLVAMNDENLRRRRIQNDLEMLMDNSNCCAENHVGRQIVSQLEPFRNCQLKWTAPTRGFSCCTEYNGSDNDDNDIW